MNKIRDEYNIVNYRENLPFNRHLQDQVILFSQHLSEKDKGHCFNFSPVILLNHNINERVLTFYDRYDGISKDEYTLYRLQRHEFFHYSCLMGSSLGSLFHIISRLKSMYFQNLMLELEGAIRFEKYKPNFLVRYYALNIHENPNYHMTIRCLRDCQAISSLFHYCGPRFTLSEYIPSLANLIFFLSPFYESFQQFDFKTFINLTLFSELFPDYVGRLGHDIEEHPTPEYHRKSSSVFVPTVDIVEAYARFSELLELLSLDVNAEKSVTRDFDSRVLLKDFLDHSLKGAYASVYNILFNLFSPDPNDLDVMFDFGLNCLFILELSLMTAFHPVLLKSRSLNLLEILIPFRFLLVKGYFASKKITIEDICDVKDNESVIKAMDNICIDLGWMPYSESINQLLTFYTKEEPLVEEYYRKCAISVLNYKKNVHVFPVEMPPDFPMLICYNDRVMPVALSMLFEGNHNSQYYSIDMLTIRIIHDLLQTVFCDQFLFASNYNGFKSLLKRISYFGDEPDRTENELLANFFEAMEYDSFLDPLI